MIQKRLSGFLERASHLSKTEDSVLNAVDSVIEACYMSLTWSIFPLLESSIYRKITWKNFIWQQHVVCFVNSPEEQDAKYSESKSHFLECNHILCEPVLGSQFVSVYRNERCCFRGFCCCFLFPGGTLTLHLPSLFTQSKCPVWESMLIRLDNAH